MPCYCSVPLDNSAHHLKDFLVLGRAPSLEYSYLYGHQTKTLSPPSTISPFHAITPPSSIQNPSGGLVTVDQVKREDDFPSWRDKLKRPQGYCSLNMILTDNEIIPQNHGLLLGSSNLIQKIRVIHLPKNLKIVV